jgi:glycosyltransferase involved in cell wall biosynthesis
VLKVAGEGPELARLQKLAAAKPGHVRFLGRLAKPQVEDELRTCVALALPARWFENQPMSILEAFALGTPVIGTRLGGLPELIDEGPGGDGLLVEPNDAAELAGAMGQLLDDPTAARRMGAAGRRKVHREFSQAAHLQGLTRLYEEARGSRQCA